MLFTIYGLVGICHALPCMDYHVCETLYRLGTSRYVTCFTIYGLVGILRASTCMASRYVTCFTWYGLVGMWHALPFEDY